MCSVRQSAVDRVYGLIPKFQKLKLTLRQAQGDGEPRRTIKTILTGCILKKDRQKFAKGFDQILRFKDLLNYQPKYQDKSTAFVPISNGCNNFCTYCVVPFVRGPLVCRDHKEILREVKDAAINDPKEIWLLGQNVNDYTSSTDKSINFVKLLQMVSKIPGNFKLFFTSPNPKDFSDELIEVMAKSPKIAKYLNLPIQSGDNQILKKMKRLYTAGQYKNLVRKIKNKIPDIYLSTDAIVGFPGETEKQFENTVKLFKEIKFNLAYIAKYSPRPGTAAWQMEDDVPLKEKKRREKILREIINSQSINL